MTATRKWLIKQPLHRSDFVNQQRAITLTGTYENVSPTKRTRYRLTEKERIKYSVNHRAAHTYRAQRRAAQKFAKKCEKNKLKNQAKLAALQAQMAA